MIESTCQALSVSRQCNLLNVPRSSFYYDPIPDNELNLLLMKEIDMQYLETPFYGSRLMTAHLNRMGFTVNRKRITRLMETLNLRAIYPKPKPKTTIPGYEKFPYLLTGIEIKDKNKVWATDITYIPLNGGYLYLVAFLDLYSRFILSWNLSNSLETTFCLEAFKSALKYGSPEIVNSDQGVQYTSHSYIDLIKRCGARISMSGKGRCWDNIFVERFWRSLKYEEVYINQYENYKEAYNSIEKYIDLFNNRRPHSALNYQTPMEVYSKL